MSDVLDKLLNDVESAEGLVPDDASLARVRALSDEMVGLAEEIASLQKQIEEKDKRRRAIAEGVVVDGKFAPGLLPSLLREIGLSSIGLPDGTSLEVGMVYRGHIKEENRDAAIDWLRANGFGEMVKNEFKMAFGKSEDERAQALAGLLETAGISYEQKIGVHPSTLNAFIREQTEAGRPVSDLLGPFITDVAQVRRTKAKKVKGSK